MKTEITRKGQKEVFIPVYAQKKPSPLRDAIEVASDSVHTLVMPRRLVIGYERVKLNWVRKK